VLHKILDHRKLSADERDDLFDLDALYRGRRAFHQRLDRFIPKRPSEDPKVYEFRKKTAHYLNYAGPIVNYFASKTFIDEPPRSRASRKSSTSGTRSGERTAIASAPTSSTSSRSASRRRWSKSARGSSSTSLEGMAASPRTKADWEASGLHNAFLCPFDECDVLDWDCDEGGELAWVITKQTDRRGATRARSRTW
jgi:hypothetical protein